MSHETPDERRERIDAARREQAELNRQIGQEFASLAIRPSAAQAWQDFQTALTVGERQYPPVRPKCFDKAEQYRNYDAHNVPSPARAKMMCATCPFSRSAGDGTCGTFAQAEGPGWGVWDGEVYGRKLADKERREAIKEQKEEA